MVSTLSPSSIFAISIAFFGSSLQAAQATFVIHKQGTGEYHRPWCSAIRDARDVVALTPGQAEARGLKSHADCEKEPAAGVGTTGAVPTPKKPSSPVIVYMDAAKYYHREGCAKAAGSVTRATLEQAAKSRWPCPVCRPPVRKKGDGAVILNRGRE